MVTDVAEWLAKPFADLAQFQPFKIKQLQRSPLYRGQVFKSAPQVPEVKSCADFVLDIGLPY
jgi:hypothetical protein